AGLDTGLLIAHAVDGPGDPAERLAALRDEAGAEHAEVRLLPPGPAADALMAAAAAEGAALLVVGSRGHSALRSGLLGSVTRALAARSPIPLVVVPPHHSEGPGGGEPNVVCGVDGSGHAVAAARIAGGLARALGGRVVIAHALKDLRATIAYLGARSTQPALTGQPDAREADAVRIVEDALGAAGDGATGVVEPGAPWDALQAVADREGAQMLAVAARGQSAARAALFGSVATRLAEEATRPILVVPEPAEGAALSRP
ncbi:MAG TPA: universal stress protein, partial [Miltoncostaeaceae bacterium]|nr:universal stress protein [Miltoncostaeaceae bacterium]